MKDRLLYAITRPEDKRGEIAFNVDYLVVQMKDKTKEKEFEKQLYLEANELGCDTFPDILYSLNVETAGGNREFGRSALLEKLMPLKVRGELSAKNIRICDLRPSDVVALQGKRNCPITAEWLISGNASISCFDADQDYYIFATEQDGVIKKQRIQSYNELRGLVNTLLLNPSSSSHGGAIGARSPMRIGLDNVNCQVGKQVRRSPLFCGGSMITYGIGMLVPHFKDMRCGNDKAYGLLMFDWRTKHWKPYCSIATYYPNRPTTYTDQDVIGALEKKAKELDGTSLAEELRCEARRMRGGSEAPKGKSNG
jgi:hypothetical protein